MALSGVCNGSMMVMSRNQLHLCLLSPPIYLVYDRMWYGVGRGAGSTARLTSEDPWHRSLAPLKTTLHHHCTRC